MLTLKENEKLVKMVRQHRSVMAGAIARSIIFTGLALFVFLKLDLDVFGYSREIIAGAVLIAVLVILHKIYIWRKNTFVITKQRVILNVWQGMLSRTVTELLYRDIYDISFKQVGFSALMNHYGKLIIKTPAQSEIIFDKVPSPAKVVGIINEIRAGGLVTDFVSPGDLRNH